MEPGGHYVQFFEDPGFLANRVAAFLASPLERGGSAIAIVRRCNQDAILGELAAHALDIDRLRDAGRLVLADASVELGRFMVDGMPDRDRFRAHIGGALAQAAAPGTAMHAYGEMVDLLWEAGNADAVIALEEMWTELCRERGLALLCGYQPRGGIAPQQLAAFGAVCACHDEVHGFEPLSATGAPRRTTMLEARTRALETEVARRSRVEQRMERLLDVASELAAARTRDVIARVAVRSGLEIVGATAAAVWELTPAGRLHLLAVSDRMAGGVTSYREIDLEGDTPIAHVLRTREPEFLGSFAAYREKFPTSFPRIEPLMPFSEGSFAVLPIIAEDRAVGAICFTYDHERQFAPADRAYKLLLARQCALAIERVQHLEAEARARAEVELLYDLTAGVNRLDDSAAVFELALATVIRGSRCDRAAILLFDDAGVMRFAASHGLSETYRAAVEGHSPWQPDAVDPAPLTVNDTERDPAWASYRDVFRAEGVRSLAFIPLLHHNRLLGKFMLYRDQPRAFEPAELQFTATVAVHVAQAVARRRAERELERAYREERAAHLEAEEATRAREEILSVVSHDLRNPLGTILMGASSLLQHGGEDRAHRTRTISERIHRQAERMARLIEDLVDFAGIQAGRLALSPGVHAPRAIIEAANEIYAPLAEERGLRWTPRSAPDLPSIRCDAERALQVIGNLVANALKVTARGGEIAVGAERAASDVVFFVRDTGPGIEPDELPRLFERYWRSKSAGYRGAGLGLSIARGIVDAHGGRIWAESALGTGSTFYFCLSPTPAS